LPLGLILQPVNMGVADFRPLVLLLWGFIFVDSASAEEAQCEGEQCNDTDPLDGGDGGDASSRGMIFLVTFGLLIIVAFVASSYVGGGSDDDFAEYEEEMSNMINGFKFGLPVEKDEYNDLKNKGSAVQILRECLMRRAIADLVRGQFLSREKSGMDTLYKKHLIKKSVWESFLKAEKMIETEMQETKNEADELGMGGNIFQAAHQQFLQLELRLATEQAIKENNLKKKDGAEKNKDDGKKKKVNGPTVHLVKPAKETAADPK